MYSEGMRCCPHCGQQMEPGFLNTGGRQLVWTTQPRKLFYTPGPDGVLVREPSFTGKGAEAWLCRRCRQVVLDY